MANWCWNQLTVQGESEQLDAFETKARSPEHIFDLNQLLPLPEGLTEGVFGWKGITERITEAWGTRCIHSKSSLAIKNAQQREFTFGSAWSPPSNEALSRISKEFPAIRFTMEYAERGMQFFGRVIVECGHVHYEERGGMRYEESTGAYVNSDGLLLPEAFQRLAALSG